MLLHYLYENCLSNLWQSLPQPLYFTLLIPLPLPLPLPFLLLLYIPYPLLLPQKYATPTNTHNLFLLFDSEMYFPPLSSVESQLRDVNKNENKNENENDQENETENVSAAHYSTVQCTVVGTLFATGFIEMFPFQYDSTVHYTTLHLISLHF